MKYIALLLTLSFPAFSGLFDEPQNLKVLDDEISAADLRETMKGFSMSLGVRCTHCHVGEEGKPLDTFDFSSDDKQAKKTARLMMKMVNKINKNYISRVDKADVKVECLTCHRGITKPQQIVDLLMAAYQEDGVATALQSYAELKQQYFGSHSYDFTERTLVNLASAIGPADADSVLSVLKKNLQDFPMGFETHFVMGQTYQMLQQKEKAIEHYEKANKIQANPRLQKMIDGLKK